MGGYKHWLAGEAFPCPCLSLLGWDSNLLKCSRMTILISRHVGMRRDNDTDLVRIASDQHWMAWALDGF
jgi:hypothetical protein